jgi:hypothetical protein
MNQLNDQLFLHLFFAALPYPLVVALRSELKKPA